MVPFSVSRSHVSGHEGIASSFVGNRRTDSPLSLFLFLSPVLRIRPLFHPLKDSNKFPATVVRFDIERRRPHVFPTTRAISRKNNFRFATIERDRRGRERDGLKRTRTSKLYVTDSTLRSCFVQNERRCAGSQLIRLNGDSSLRDYLAVSSGSVMDQTSCSAWPCVPTNVFAVVTYPSARTTADTYIYTAFNPCDLAWNYYPER